MAPNAVESVISNVVDALQHPDAATRQVVAHKLLADTERQRAFGVRNLGARHRGLVAGGLQPMLSFFAALEEVAESNVELLGHIDVVAGEILRTEERDELGVNA